MLGSSCTRPEATDSQVSFSLPTSLQGKLGAQNTQLLTDVVINVSGPGIPANIIMNWSLDRPSELCTGAGSCSFTAPMGKDRLIQVLAIYKDGENQSFLYGDRMSALEASNLPIEISVASIFSGANIVEADLKGRFLTSATAGPTGIMDIKFKPEGKPAMQLMRSEMVNGWFSSFAMTGVRFQYSVGDLVLFGGPKNLEELRAPASPQVLETSFPAYYYHQGDQSSPRLQQRASNRLMGFWGPGAAGKKVCYSSTPGSLSHMYAAATGAATLMYDPLTTDSSKVRVLVSAGRNNDCTGLEEDISSMNFNPLSSGGDRNRGIYVRSEAGSFLSGVAINEVPHIQWEVLPGVSDVVSGYHVFEVLNESQMMKYRLSGGDNMNCQRIFDERANLTGVANYLGAATSQVRAIAVSPNQFSSAFLICPFSNSRIFMSALFDRVRDNSNQNNGGGPPAKLVLRHMSGISGHAKRGNCEGLSLEILDAQNHYTNWNSSFNLQVMKSGVPQTVYPNYMDCSNNVNGVTTASWVPQTQNQYIVKMPASGSSVAYEPSTAATFNSVSLVQLATTINIYAPGAVIISMNGPWRILPGMCYEFTVNSKTIDFQAALAPAGGYAVALNPSVGVLTYSNNSCTTPITTVGIPPGSSSATFYAKANAEVTGNINFNLTSTGANAGAVSGISQQNPSIGSGTITPSKVRFDGSNQVTVGSCSQLSIGLYNQNEVSVIPGSPLVIDVGYSGGPNVTLYDSDNCAPATVVGALNSNAISGSVTFAAGATRKVLGVKFHATGGGTLSLGRSAAPILDDGTGFSMNANAGMGGGTATKLRFRVEELTAINMDACIPVFLEPLNSDDTLGEFPSPYSFTISDAAIAVDSTTVTAANSSYGDFYDSENCLGSARSSAMSLQGPMKIYYKNTASAADIANIPFDQSKIKYTATTSSGAALVDFDPMTYRHTPLSGSAFKISGPTSIVNYACNQYEISLIDNEGNRVKAASDISSISLSGLSVSGNFYNNYDSNCMDAPTSSVGIYTGNSNARVFVMVNSNISNASLNASASGPINGSLLNVTSTAPGAASRLILEPRFHGGAFRKHCQEFIVSPADASGNVTVRGSATNLQFSSTIGTDGYFFETEASCGVALNGAQLTSNAIAANTTSLDPNTPRKRLWFLNDQTSAPASSVDVTLSSSDSLSPSTRTFGPYSDSSVAYLKALHNSGGTGIETNFLNFGLCEKLMVRRLNISNGAVFNEPDLAFKITTSTADFTLHVNNDCSDAGGAFVYGKIWSGQQEGYVYMKHINSGNLSSETPVLEHSTLMLGANQSMSNSMTFNKGTLALNPQGSTFGNNTCQPFSWNWNESNFRRANNSSLNATAVSHVNSSSVNINDANLSAVMTGSAQFYPSSCPSPTGSSSGVTKGNSFYVKGTVGSAVINYTFSITEFGRWFNIGPTSFTVN